MNIPLATAVAARPIRSEPRTAEAVPNQFAVVVPPGVAPGQLIETRTPDGQQVQVAVPAGGAAQLKR